ncbi:MAG: 5'-nucleotidase C-terminal domain-containing protein [Anaerolineae bacterium]
MSKTLRLIALLVLMSLAIMAATGSFASAATTVNFTILHTNDFHGQLQLSGSNPGLARVATKVNEIRTAKGAGNVLLVDGGDEMQGSLLSNLQKGVPTIAAFNAMGYSAATFGNHEFDWGQTVLNSRTTQATYDFLSANIVKGTCDASNWTVPDQFKVTPYIIRDVAGLKVGFIGVTSTETPIITVATSTTGLCFKDPADSIIHYYDQMKTNGAQVIIVLSHLGWYDGGYGYGIPVYGDLTLADKLNKAGKSVPLIIGGHSHSNIGGTALTDPKAVGVVGSTKIVQAYYNGRQLGQADFTYDTSTNTVTDVTWTQNKILTSATEDPTVKGVIDTYANDAAYLALVNTEIGYSAVDLPRSGGNVDNMMGTFVDDAIYSYLNTDAEATNDIDIFFNNAGGIRTDWCYVGGTWLNAGCVSGTHTPGLLTYGNMFTILPFGNATIVGKMTGAQILEVLNQSATLGKGAIQPAGIKYKYYAYTDGNPGPQPFAWGAFDATVYDRTSHTWVPLQMDKTYSVGTNEFLAPAGGDNFVAFKYMTNITYWGDMLNAVDDYVSKHYGTPATAYTGPHSNGTLDDRILRDGTSTPDSGSIKPITVLHHNDSHGNLVKGSYVGYTQLVTLIKQERLHNPNRTLLLSGGDNIQGDAMMYYFKSAPSGFAADGTPLSPPLTTHPMMAAMNSMNYDAMTLGNHEFNFGNTVFDGIFKQAQFPLLGANVTDSGAYGLNSVGPSGEGVKPYVLTTRDGIKIAIVGITNHRVPNYELPSNIVGLTFSNPIATAQTEVNAVRAGNDVVLALTHVGFTTNPKSVEVDSNVDTNLAAQVTGVDAIIGAHSHTNPASPEAPYKYLPTIVGGPNNTPVLINQAYRYNNTLGETIIGVRAKAGGGYEVVSRVGGYITVSSSTPVDAATNTLLQPYVNTINTYNAKIVGKTTVPIDTLQSYTQETNGANLQADASMWELSQHGITPDFHLSGAMTNKLMASGATPATPVSLTIADMFAGMPYENSLVTLKMNGPQIKAVLERAFRNFYYYKHVSGYGGYSYYPTCMIDTNLDNQITYNDTYPAAYDANVNHVVGFKYNGQDVDFTDASKYYLVSTVNYLAAGSCNFNDNGVSLWPLSQIVNDTQYYVRDAVIDYLAFKGTVSPAIEGRIQFNSLTDANAPLISITSPTAKTYAQSATPLITVAVTDSPAGVRTVWKKLDDATTARTNIDLFEYMPGKHTFLVQATDNAGNFASKSVAFTINATVPSTIAGVTHYYNEKKITNATVRDNLIAKLKQVQSALGTNPGSATAAQKATAKLRLQEFITMVKSQSGKAIDANTISLLVAEAQWIIAHF